MDFQLVAIFAEQAGRVEAFGNGRPFVKRRLALLIRHLEEKQKRQLLRACAEPRRNIVPVRQAVVAQDVTVVPEFLDKTRRGR